MAKVEFCKPYFEKAFPILDLSKFSDFALDTAWHTAVAFVGDDDANSFAPFDPERGVTERMDLLYLALAHIVQVQLMAQQNAASGLSGRLSSVSEGSVSVTVEPFKADSLNAQWWTQTPEGQLYWMMTAKYRLGGRVYAFKEAHPWG